MLRATAFPVPYNSVPLLLTRSFTAQNDTSHSLAALHVIHAHSALPSRFEFQQFRQPRVNLRVVHGGQFVTAAAKKKRRGRAGLATIDDDCDDDDEYDDDDDDGDEDERDDGDSDGQELLPLEQMRRLFKKKPKGFGEGKVYDTSVEDKLLEEMRQSRKAQAANLKKLKDNPVKPGSDKNNQKKKDAEVVPVGGRVRMVNLPKKKNIHRDLKLALEGIPGKVNIVPVVSGNKKTRDPICKGFAFVDFKCGDDAARFVELYSGQTISFGKIQRQIKCELVNAESSFSAAQELSKNLIAAPHLMVSDFEEDSNEDSVMEDSAFSSWNGATSDDPDDELNNQIQGEEVVFGENQESAADDPDDELDDQILGEEDEVVGENLESATTLKVDYDDSVESNFDSEISLLSSEQININPTTAEEKSSAEVKQENDHKKSRHKAKKVAKFNIPGSAKRLKIKEKAILNDVFNKYKLKAGVPSKDS